MPAIRKIKHHEFFKLCKYLENRRGELERVPTTFVEIAKQAGQVLSLEISPGTVSKAIYTVGIQIKKNNVGGQGPLWNAVLELARAHRQLCGSLGVNCPPTIELLTNSQPDPE